MTIKKIALSAVAAALVSTVAFAGTVSTTSKGLIGQEQLSLADVNISSPFENVVYTPTNIPATSLKNPIFKFTFGNAKNMDKFADANASVWECQDGNETNTSVDNWRLVAQNPQFSGTDNNIVSFNAVSSDIYVYNNKKYIVADGNSTDSSAVISAFTTTLGLQVTKGSTSDLTLKTELYSGDSQSRTDFTEPSAIAKVGPEFTGSVTQKFNNTIDASASFAQFHDFDTVAESTTTDKAIFNIHRNATLGGASLGAVNPELDVLFDQNTSKYITGGVFDTGVGTLNSAGTLYDLNATTTTADDVFPDDNTAVDTNTTLTLTVGPVKPDEIKKTVFTAHAYVVSGTSVFDIIQKTTQNAGEWTIYGYNAQIPNVASTKTVDVTMKFTNRSSIPADIFFTLIDPAGHTVSLSSKDYSEIASIPANTTGEYKASMLVPLATAKNPDFDASSSFSVEVSIPTTPTSVYGMASFKNKTLGQFKDLPIYSNGNHY